MAAGGERGNGGPGSATLAQPPLGLCYGAFSPTWLGPFGQTRQRGPAVRSRRQSPRPSGAPGCTPCWLEQVSWIAITLPGIREIDILYPWHQVYR